MGYGQINFCYSTQGNTNELMNITNNVDTRCYVLAFQLKTVSKHGQYISSVTTVLTHCRKSI